MDFHSPELPSYEDNMMIHWVDDMPQPRNTKAFMKEQIQQMFQSVAALPYKGEWNPDTQRYEIPDPRFYGCTNAQVAVMRDWDEAVKSDGGKARERVMDRILGKPKQAIESVSMNMTFEDWLMQSAKESEAEQQNYIDVTPSEEDIEDLLRGI